MIPLKQLVWQPHRMYDSHYDIAVTLCKDFAKEMYDLNVPQECLLGLNALAKDQLAFRGYSYNSPLQFQSDSGLLSQVYIGSNGKWLSLDTGGCEPDFRRNLTFSGHNLDSAHDRDAVLAMFSLWVEYANQIKNAAIPKH